MYYKIALAVAFFSPFVKSQTPHLHFVAFFLSKCFFLSFEKSSIISETTLQAVSGYSYTALSLCATEKEEPNKSRSLSPSTQGICRRPQTTDLLWALSSSSHLHHNMELITVTNPCVWVPTRAVSRAIITPLVWANMLNLMQPRMHVAMFMVSVNQWLIRPPV